MNKLKLLVSALLAILFTPLVKYIAFAEQNSTSPQYDPSFNAATATGVTNNGSYGNSDGNTFSPFIKETYSRDIEYKALPQLMFYQFAVIESQLMTEPGNAINMLTVDNLALGGKLDEGRNIYANNLSASMKQIIVSEYGNAVAVSRLTLETSYVSVMDSATTLLARDYAIVLDCELRNAALGLGATTKATEVFARKSDGTVVTARANLDETCTFKVSTIKDAIEILATRNAPKHNLTNSWVLFLHPHCSRGLRDDNAWINRSDYADPNALLTGEIGRVDDTRAFETTIMLNGAAAPGDVSYDASLVAGTVPVYQSVLFGDGYFGYAESVPVEIREGDVTDFGRRQSYAWYSIFGVGRLHEDYGVIIESA